MGIVTIALAASLVVGAGPTSEEVAWVQQHKIPLAHAEAGNGFEDLQPLKSLIGDARIVSLGEPTHGTREAFQFKHRMMEFLASEMDFTIFSIEASMPESYELNPWVLGETGEGTDDEAARLVGGMYFWTWNTEEVLAMVKWMRQFNAAQKGAGSAKRVQFTGFDMQTPDVAREIVKSFVEEHRPESLAVVRDCYTKAARYSPGNESGSSGFGVATGTFPPGKAAGRKLVFSGWIKTRDVVGGYGGLWWRCDTKAGGAQAFDNMGGRGPSGTTDWARYEIVMDVPKDTQNINFGMIMPGKGTAWFDDLRIELDGEEYVDPEMCLDFENEEVHSFAGLAPGYRVTRDEDVVHGGKRSLKIEHIADRERPIDGDDAEKDRVTGAEAARLAKKALEELLEHREALTKTAGREATEWAIQNARVVSQCYRMFSKGFARGFNVRDQSMADNVEWILENNPGAKIVLWAHNGHVARHENWMGKFLEEKFPGDEMFVVGFATSRGEYTAMSSAGKGLKQDLKLMLPPEDSVEAILSQAGPKNFIIGLRDASVTDPGSAWAREPRPLRSIGALEQSSQFYPVAAADLYDALVYQDTTSAAVQLKTRAGRRKE